MRTAEDEQQKAEQLEQARRERDRPQTKGGRRNRAYRRRLPGPRATWDTGRMFRRPTARVRVHQTPLDPTRAQRPAKARRLAAHQQPTGLAAMADLHPMEHRMVARVGAAHQYGAQGRTDLPA